MNYLRINLVAALCVLLIGIPGLAGIQKLIPAGTVVQVRMIDSISSETGQPGQIYRGSLAAPVVINGRTILPKGANAYVRLSAAESAGKIKGRSELMLQLDRVATRNHTYAMHSDVVAFRGSSQGKKTAKSAGIGGAIGAGAGALLGGGKGAAIGAGLGAGTGVGYRAIKGGKQIYIPSESLVNFRLAAPIHVRE